MKTITCYAPGAPMPEWVRRELERLNAARAAFERRLAAMPCPPVVLEVADRPRPAIAVEITVKL